MDGTCGVRFTRYYEATPTEVWAALTEPDSLARWLAPPGEIELTPGGSFELRPAGDEALAGRVREVERERLLELDWPESGSEPSIVRFELRQDGGGTVLVLDHRRIDALVGMRTMAWWGRHLQRLEGVLAR